MFTSRDITIINMNTQQLFSKSTTAFSREESEQITGIVKIKKRIATTIRFHFPPASLFGTTCFHSLLDHVSRNIIILIIDIKMAILNVFLSRKITILPWNIVFVSEAEHFYSTTSSKHIYRVMDVFILVKAEVGTGKDKLDLVDLNLVIGPVVESFGRFVKYSVREKPGLYR